MNEVEALRHLSGTRSHSGKFEGWKGQNFIDISPSVLICRQG